MKNNTAESIIVKYKKQLDACKTVKELNKKYFSIAKEDSYNQLPVNFQDTISEYAEELEHKIVESKPKKFKPSDLDYTGKPMIIHIPALGNWPATDYEFKYDKDNFIFNTHTMDGKRAQRISAADILFRLESGEYELKNSNKMKTGGAVATLRSGQEVMYKDTDGEFTLKGYIYKTYTQDGITLYAIEGAGSYTADELRPIKTSKKEKEIVLPKTGESIYVHIKGAHNIPTRDVVYKWNDPLKSFDGYIDGQYVGYDSEERLMAGIKSGLIVMGEMNPYTPTGKYGTKEKQMAFLKKKGNIVTFKNQFYPAGTMNGGYRQTIVDRLKVTKSGACKIEGSNDTPWYKSTDDLLNAVDWKYMEEYHEDDDKYEDGGLLKSGKVIGYTKSGKSVYENKSANHSLYKNFSASEHNEACEIHKDAGQERIDNSDKDGHKKHLKIHDSHRELARVKSHNDKYETGGSIQGFNYSIGGL